MAKKKKKRDGVYSTGNPDKHSAKTEQINCKTMNQN